MVWPGAPALTYQWSLTNSIRNALIWPGNFFLVCEEFLSVIWGKYLLLLKTRGFFFLFDFLCNGSNFINNISRNLHWAQFTLERCSSTGKTELLWKIWLISRDVYHFLKKCFEYYVWLLLFRYCLSCCYFFAVTSTCHNNRSLTNSAAGIEVYINIRESNRMQVANHIIQFSPKLPDSFTLLKVSFFCSFLNFGKSIFSVREVSCFPHGKPNRRKIPSLESTYVVYTYIANNYFWCLLIHYRAVLL